ncbi:MAG: hypothetical protein CMH57_09415 [Myxococcales bacterium]|nr:hypothetical protein [Myxococcales bacterium]
MDDSPSESRRPQAAQSLAACWQQHYPDEVVAEMVGRGFSDHVELADSVIDPDALHLLLNDNPNISNALLSLDGLEARARAETIRRQALLSGLGDVEVGLTALVRAGLVIMVPEPGQRGWSLLEEIETRRFLQRELIWPAPLLEWLRHALDLEAARHELGGILEQDVIVTLDASVSTLELNLLHLSSGLCGDALILNKDGSPNRRSLTRFIKGLILPGRDLGAEPDPMKPDDYEAAFFLLGLGLQLGLLHEDERELTANPRGLEAFFTANEAERDRLLMRAYRSCAHWSEFEAHALLERSSGLTFDSTTPRRAVLGGNNDWASRFSGVRGQVLSDLNKLPWGGWADVDAVVELLLALDRGYLGRALEAEIDSAPTLFLRSVLVTALPWLGVARLGKTQRGRLVIAMTERGRRLLRIDPPSRPVSSERPPPLMCLPNFEVTVFRDAITLRSMFTLYRVGERINLADHVATFRMSAETVQRGYSDGLTAEALLAFLKKNARTPIPDNIAWTLDDWERVHQKITLYARGSILQHPDPDALDLDLGTLQHYWKPDEPLVHLSSTDVFLPTLELSVLSRVFDVEKAHKVDYAQTTPPCLERTGELTFAPLPTGLDFVTRAELPRFADPVGEPEWPDAWTLNVEKIRSCWGDDAVSGLLGFLSERLEGGVPASLELRILTLLGEEVSARVERGAVILHVSSEEVCAALAEVPEVEEHILARLGPTSLHIDANGAEAVEAALANLGLDGRATGERS